MKSKAPLRIVAQTHRSVVVETELESLKFKIAQPKESATEIAARLRAGKPPLRHLIYRETIDGERA